MKNAIGGFFTYPIESFKNGTVVYLAIWLGLMFMLGWILSDYGILPKLPRIGKGKNKQPEQIEE